MKITADRGVEIAQGIAEIQRICTEYNLVSEWNFTHSDTNWLEVWADNVDDLESLCANVAVSFGEDLNSVSQQDTVFSIAGSNGWDVSEDNEGQLIIYTNVYDKGI